MSAVADLAAALVQAVDHLTNRLRALEANDRAELAGAVVFSGARVSLVTGNQTLPDMSEDPIAFDTAEFDTGGYWDAGTPNQFTVTLPGWYRVQAAAAIFPSGASAGWTNLFIYLNGNYVATAYGTVQSGDTQTNTLFAEATLALVAGDIVTFTAYQNSGGAGTIDGTNDVGTYAAIHFVGI